MSINLILPHGGKLINRVAGSELKKELLVCLSGPVINLSLEQAKTIENIATGVYSPLTGFMDEPVLAAVLEKGRLPNGIPWTLPVVLPVPDFKIAEGQNVALNYQGTTVAVLKAGKTYPYSKKLYAEAVYQTCDENHPGVKKVFAYGPYFLGGDFWQVDDIPTPFAAYKYTPAQTRAIFAQKGWQKIVAFQTRNVPHLGHEYIQKAALTHCDALFINPVIGRKKSGDFTDNAILSSYQALVDFYYRPDNTMLAILEYEMEYAGPKEAIHHSIMRKNFGCSHFIIGRDHAGVGNYYSPYAAQEIFKEYPDLGITTMIFNSAFYCQKCGAIVNEKICPHLPEDHLDFSGTKIRNYFLAGGGKEDLTDLMRKEVVESLLKITIPFV